jgi:hypothetical protein
MRKSLVSPFFAWTEAVLKGGWNVLDSMQDAVRQGPKPRVGVVPTADAPAPRPRRRAGAKAKPKVRAKKRRR